LQACGISAFGPTVDDRTLWQRCQRDGWVLFTDNRNDDGETSLQATLTDLWTPGNLPVLTLADKKNFDRSAEYRERVAAEIGDVLFGIANGEYHRVDIEYPKSRTQHPYRVSR